MEEIAWEKGGIFKTGVPSLSVEQGREGASIVLRQCAQAVGEKLEVSESDERGHGRDKTATRARRPPPPVPTAPPLFTHAVCTASVPLARFAHARFAHARFVRR